MTPPSLGTWRPATLVCVLLMGSAACVTPRPVLDGEGEAFVSRAQAIDPFGSEKSHPIVERSASADVWGDLSGSTRAPSAQRSNIVEFGYRFYSNYLSKVDGPRCEHRPTCSRYAMESVRKHGAVVGSWLTIDRLLRSGRSSSLKPLPIAKYYEGQVYFADPVEENDFFF